MTGQPAPLLFSTFFGAQMALAAAGPGTPSRIAAALALAAVVAGVFHRPAATAAVLAAVAALALSDPSPLFAAVSGLSAAAYLVIRYAVGAADDTASAAVTVTAPTVAGMLVFSLAAVLAAVLPWRWSWVPLLAPAAVVAILVLAGTGLFRADPVRYE